MALVVVLLVILCIALAGAAGLGFGALWVVKNPIQPEPKLTDQLLAEIGVLHHVAHEEVQAIRSLPPLQLPSPRNEEQ